MKRNDINFQMFSYIHSIVVSLYNVSGISSYILSPVVSSIGPGASDADSSGVRLYSAYGAMTVKI